MGQITLATGHIPTTDFLTFTQIGQPWMNQAWLMQVVLYLLYTVGGLPLVIFTHAVTIAMGYLLVLWACVTSRQGIARAGALAVLGAAALGALYWTVRPQSASFLLFGLLVYSIERHRLRGGRMVWIWPALFALWANLHGAFVFGLGLLAIYIVSRVVEDVSSRRRLSPDVVRVLMAGGVAAAATALNPAGPLGIATYVLGFVRSTTTITRNMEFQPLSIRETDGAVFVGLMAGFILLTAYRRTRLPRYQIATVILLGLGSLYAGRVLPWFGMAVAPAFALALASRRDGPADTQTARPGSALLNYTVATLLCGLVLLSLPWFRPLLPASWPVRPYAFAETTPARAAEIVCRLGPETRLFNNQAYGSYLAWACPTLPLFIDTRIELYPAAQWEDYRRIVNALFDWDVRLREYGINTLFLQKQSEKELVVAVRRSAQWTTVYEDGHAVVLQRIRLQPAANGRAAANVPILRANTR